MVKLYYDIAVLAMLVRNKNGKRLAVLNTSAYGKNYEVWIDGKKYGSIEVAPVTLFSNSE